MPLEDGHVCPPLVVKWLIEGPRLDKRTKVPDELPSSRKTAVPSVEVKWSKRRLADGSQSIDCKGHAFTVTI